MPMIDPFARTAFRSLPTAARMGNTATAPGLPGFLAAPATGPAQSSSPTEESLLMSSVGRPALSGLGMLGAAFDLPGSMVRDTLAGRNPLDQLLTPFSGENRTSGRELAREYGLAGRGDNWGNFAGGLAVEMAFDPLTYLTLGGSALTKSGTAARSTGLLDDLGRQAANAKLGPRAAKSQFTLNDLVQGSVDPDAALRTVQEYAGKNQLDATGLLNSSEPLGRAFGLGLPFADPSLTFSGGRLGTALNAGLDRAGAALKRSRPVVGLRGLLDPSAGGKFTPVEQEIAELAYKGRKVDQALAKQQYLRAFDDMEQTFQEFNQQFGTQVRGVQAGQVDPRDLDAALDEILSRKLHEWNDPTQRFKREFRKKHFGVVKQVQEGKDPASIRGFDLLLDEFRQRATESGQFGDDLLNLDEEDLMEILRETDPFPTRNSPELQAQAQREADRSLFGDVDPEEYPFNQGEVVIAADRGNYGYVRQVGAKSSRVFFRNPQTGATAERLIPNEQLTRAFAAGSEEAEDFATLMTRKIFHDVSRMAAETQDVDRAFNEFLGTGLTPETERLGQEILSRGQEMQAANKAIHSAIAAKGGKAAWLSKDEVGLGVEHFPRTVDSNVARESVGGSPILARKHGNMQGRTEVTRDLPAAVVNRILREKRYRKDGAQKILDDFGDDLNPNYGANQNADDFDFGANALDPQVGKRQHAEALADWVKTRRQTDLYTKDMLDDFFGYQRRAQTTSRHLEAVHDVFRRHVRAVPGEEDLLLEDAFRAAGMDPDTSLQYFADKFQMPLEDVQELAVSKDLVQQVRGVNDVVNAPAWAQAIGDQVDKFNKLFKTWVTVPFPGFAARNLTSGQHVNIASGLLNGPGDLKDYGQSFVEAHRLQKAVRKNGLEQLSAADRELLREISAWGVISDKGFMDIDFRPAGRSGHPLREVIPESPLDMNRTSQQARQAVGDTPGIADQLPGMLPLRRAARTWADTGAKINQQVEWQNRVSMYLYLRKQKGFSAEAAASKVDELQFDYSDLAPFERDVLRRAFPFYGFTRKVVPMFTQALTERPGGAWGQTLRATSQNQRERTRPLPDYLEQTAAVPLQTMEDGTQRFLTGFGLAHEVPAGFLGGGVRGAGMEALAMMNPLVKAPLEWAVGESFFQRGPSGGRDLDDMDPTLGRTLTNLGLQAESPSGRAQPVLGSGLLEHLVANSPVARLSSTARQLTDPRKLQGMAVPGDALALNLLTGMNVSDVSPGSMDAVLRESASALARKAGARTYGVTRFSKEAIADAQQRDPAEAQRMQAFNDLMGLMARNAKERKRQQQGQ